MSPAMRTVFALHTLCAVTVHHPVLLTLRPWRSEVTSYYSTTSCRAIAEACVLFFLVPSYYQQDASFIPSVPQSTIYIYMWFYKQK